VSSQPHKSPGYPLNIRGGRPQSQSRFGGEENPSKRAGSYGPTHVIKDRGHWWAPVNTTMNLRAPQNAGNFLTSKDTVSLSRITLLHGVIMYHK